MEDQWCRQHRAGGRRRLNPARDDACDRGPRYHNVETTSQGTVLVDVWDPHPKPPPASKNGGDDDVAGRTDTIYNYIRDTARK